MQFYKALDIENTFNNLPDNTPQNETQLMIEKIKIELEGV